MNNILIDHNLKLNDYKKDLLNIFKNNNYTQGPYNSRFVKELKKLFERKIFTPSRFSHYWFIYLFGGFRDKKR